MIKERIVNVEKNYRCPFCPNHENEYYMIWEGLMDTPICGACNREIEYFLLTPPDEGIWFGFDLRPMETSTLERLTGKSIYELQLSFALHTLDYYRDHENFDRKINYYTEGLSEDDRKQCIREERREWIKGIRYRKKLIRKLIRLQDKMQKGNIYEDILCGWRDARRINKEKHVK
jgi:hypothetical protein